MRLPLREQVFEMLLDDILKGSFNAGEKLKDTEIAKRLGISRTPAREALIRLEEEGYLVNNMGRGFEIVSIGEREVVEIYLLVAELEFFALNQIKEIDDKILNNLIKINNKLTSMKLNPIEKMNLDIKWHEIIVSLGNNETLKKTIKSFKKKTVWFELNYMKTEDTSTISAEDHTLIIDMLKKSNFPEAAKLLKKNCLRTAELIRNTKRGEDNEQSFK